MMGTIAVFAALGRARRVARMTMTAAIVAAGLLLQLSSAFAGGSAEVSEVFRKMPDDMLCSVNLPESINNAPAVYRMQIAACTRQLNEVVKANGGVTDAVGWIYKSRGDVYVHLKDCRHAVADFSAAIALYKDDPYPYLDRGLCYRSLGDVERALSDFTGGIRAAERRKAKNLKLITPEALYALFAQRGKALLDLGRPQESLKSFRVALILRPKDGFVTGLMAKAQSEVDVQTARAKELRECRGKDPGRRIDGCTRLIDNSGTPENMKAAAYLGRAIAYGKEGKLNRAIVDLGEVIKRRPDDPQPLYIRGLTFARTGNFDKALGDLSKVIRLRPDAVAAYKARGQLYERQGVLDKAAIDYRRALAIAPNDKEAQGWLDAVSRRLAKPGDADTRAARADCESGDIRRQLDGCGRLIAATAIGARERADAYYNRGLAYGRSGHSDKAVADFTQAIGLTPGNAKLFVVRGLGLARLKRDKEAMTDFSAAIDIEPKNADAHYFRGLIYVQLGTAKGDEAAIADMSAVIAADPKRARAYFVRGILYERKRDMAQARADLAKSLAIEPGNVAALKELKKLQN